MLDAGLRTSANEGIAHAKYQIKVFLHPAVISIDLLMQPVSHVAVTVTVLVMRLVEQMSIIHVE